MSETKNVPGPKDTEVAPGANPPELSLDEQALADAQAAGAKEEAAKSRKKNTQNLIDNSRKSDKKGGKKVGGVEVEKPSPKYLGKFGVYHLVVRLQPKEVNGRIYNEILTHDGQTFLLSDMDLKNQLKSLDE